MSLSRQAGRHARAPTQAGRLPALRCLAEVLESDDEEQKPKEISIRVGGLNVIENKELFEHIRAQIRQLQVAWFKDNLTYVELIPCRCKRCRKADESEREFYKLHNLIRKDRNNTPTIPSGDEPLSIRKMIDGFYDPQTLERDQRREKHMGDVYNLNAPTQFNKDFKDQASATENIAANPAAIWRRKTNAETRTK